MRRHKKNEDYQGRAFVPSYLVIIVNYQSCPLSIKKFPSSLRNMLAIIMEFMPIAKTTIVCI